jgi:hypothetical protein
VAGGVAASADAPASGVSGAARRSLMCPASGLAPLRSESTIPLSTRSVVELTSVITESERTLPRGGRKRGDQPGGTPRIRRPSPISPR